MLKHYTKVTKEEWPCAYFSPAELACRGTGLVNLNPEAVAAMKKLDALRRAMGHPLIVNSGYRSPEWNLKVGGAKSSYHMRGVAFDVSMSNVDPHRFEAEAKSAGFTGIGLYPPQKPSGARNFIHVDTRVDLGGKPWRGVQWGEFPRRASRFDPEAKPEPVKDAMRDTAPKVAGGALVIEAIAQAEPAIRQAAPFLPEHWQGLAYGALALVAVVLAFRALRGRRQAGEGEA